MLLYQTALLAVIVVNVTDGLLVESLRGSDVSRHRRCTHVRTYQMLGADCCDVGLTFIPKELKTDIEILDATYNRIRELHNTSFLNYPSLRFLYLADNSIAHIESGTFDPLTELEVLDLSLNSLHMVPEGMNSLSSLWKLLLSQNPLGNVVFFEFMPSLEVLSLSECKLRKLPNLSALPGLKHLNYSFNNLQSIIIPELASLCRLKEFDIRGNRRIFHQDYCECALLTTWTKSHEIKLYPDSDTMCLQYKLGSKIIDNSTHCFNNETQLILEESESIARSCETEVQRYGSGPIKLKNYFIWLIVAACCFSSILACCVILYCVQKKNKNVSKKAEIDECEDEQFADNHS